MKIPSLDTSFSASTAFRWVGISLAALLLINTGCSPKSAPPGAPPGAPQVTVAPVEQQEIVEWNEFTGYTEAVEKVEIRPRVSGHIRAVRFQSGQLVKKGDVLFEIDPRWQKADFDRRQAEYSQAKVHLENAEREAKRTSLLLTNKAISTEEADAREARFHEAAAALLAAEAGRDSSKLDLEFTEIRSPIDGRVSRALLTEGNYASGVAGMTTLLTTVVSVDPVHVYADVDENSLLKFNKMAQAQKEKTGSQPKTPVQMQLADEDGFPHEGFIESFDNRVDSATGSILLRSVFPNTDGRIVPGLFARIRVPGSEKHNVMLIDERAIGTDQAQKFVLSLTPTNTVAYRPITLGPSHNGKRIVRSGLQAGEQIVVNGLQRVRPGSPVSPQSAGVTNDSPKSAQR